MSELQIGIAQFIQNFESSDISLNFTAGGLGILVYILQALALYTIAKRRGINKPWLAWIPLVNVWILGAVSDQYQYVVKRQVKNKRKALLGLNIAIGVLASVVITASIWIVVDMILTLTGLWNIHPNLQPSSDMLMQMAGEYIGVLLVAVLAIIPLLVLSIIQTIFFYMALYDVFRSCEPKNSTLYLVLSLVGNVVVEGAYSIFLMLCKDKDLGMPPRKEEPEVIPARPVERDPWEN